MKTNIYKVIRVIKNFLNIKNIFVIYFLFFSLFSFFYNPNKAEAVVYTMTVVASGPGSVGGGGSYLAGTTAYPTATPDANAHLVSWSPSWCLGAVVMDGSVTCTATFAYNDYSISYTATNGSVSPTSCTYGSSVTPVCTPNSGYQTTSCPGTFTCDTTNSKTATFSPVQTWALTISVSPAGAGTVSGAGTYNNGVTATMGYTTNTGYTFSSWSGAGCSTGSVLMDGARSCTANFTGNSCNLPWGGSISSGSSTPAFSTSTVPYGSTCTQESRVCTAGSLSGSYTNASCTVNPGASCNVAPWGAIAHNASVNAYSVSSVAWNAACPAPTSRTCVNGTLGGTGAYNSCSVTPAANCVGTWGTVNHGSSLVTSTTTTATYPTTCTSNGSQTCTNGSGISGYNGCTQISNGTCSATLNTCTYGTLGATSSDSSNYYWGCNGVNGGTSTTATACTKAKASCTNATWGTHTSGWSGSGYPASSADVCTASVSVSCNDGTYTNGGAYSSCTVNSYPITYSITGSGSASPASCTYGASVATTCSPSGGWSTSSCPSSYTCGASNTKSVVFVANQCTGTPWGTVADGYSNTAYSTSTPSGSTTCASIAQSRVCSGGSMSGSYTATSCTQGCSDGTFGDFSNGGTTTGYSSSSAVYPTLCSSYAGTRTCGGGTVSSFGSLNNTGYPYGCTQYYVASFDSAGGTAYGTVNYQAGQTVTSPGTPTRSGFTFNGWSPALPGAMPSANTTYTAQWRANQAALTLTNTTGTYSSGVTVSTSGGSGTGAVTYAISSAGTAGCSVGSSSGVVTFTSVGTCTITATKADDGTYSAISTSPTTVTINQGTQSALTLTSTSGAYGSTLSLTTSGGSGGGAVTYVVTSAGTALCSVVGSTLSNTSTGTCTVTATKASDTNYTSISSTATTVTIGLGTQAALTLTSITGTYPTSVTLTTSGGSGGGAVTYVVTSAGTALCSVAGATLSFTSAGSCTVTATKASDTNYTSISSTATMVTIAKTAQATLNFSGQTVTYPTPFAAMSTTGGSGGGAVTYAVTTPGAGCSVSGTTLSYTSGGTCRVTATKAADANYAVASSTEATFTINATTQSALTLTSTTGTYPTPVTLTTSGGSGTGVVNYNASNGTATGCAITGTSPNFTLSSTSAGTCTVTATKAGDTNYSVISSSGTTVNISLGTQTPPLVVTAQSVMFGTQFATLATTGGSGNGAVTYAITSAGTAVCSVAGSTLSYTNSGTCTVTATKVADTGYNAISSAAQTFTVTVNNLPSLNNPTASPIGTTTATLGATIVGLGVPAAITERGTCWGTSQNPLTNCVVESTGTVPAVKVLVVGGGGGGGGGMGGGGGGGGVRYNPSMTVSPQTYYVNVGAAIAGGAGQYMVGNTGYPSSFNGLNASGGGGGGAYTSPDYLPLDGGSGGGAGGYSGNIVPGGIGTAGQGYNGGASSMAGYPYLAGGGGGAGGVGQNAQMTTGGNGGPGFGTDISGTWQYYGGGGGGGGYYGVTCTGGLGYDGGGNGNCTSSGNAWPGAANTGGGGGGAGWSTGIGGGGGSGVVIISYTTGSLNVTSSVTPTTSGGNTIHTFSTPGNNWVFTVNSVATLTTETFTHARTGFAENTTYYYRGFATNATTGRGYSPDGIFTTLGKPTVTSPNTSSITTTGATLEANLTLKGNPATITEKGFYWGTSATPTTNKTIVAGAETGVFSLALTGLTAETTYYFRGYATNNTGTAYSADGTFKVLSIPLLNASSATSVQGTTATLGATVTSLGGPAAISERGVCYGLSADPTSSTGTCVSQTTESIGTVKTLIVGGGGSGGNHNTTNANGGGGGGGVIYNTAVPVTATTYSVTVGNGGVGVNGNSAGNNGGDSSFNSLIAKGGGGGASSAGYAAKDGGSGGGGAYATYSAGNSNQTGGFGYAGGAPNASYLTGGGGGGAGSAGSPVINGSSSPDGNGGAGYASDISGTMKYYAGGGGGGANTSQRSGDGFDGGGRGFGTTTYYTSWNLYPNEVNATTRGSGTPNAVANTGGGGGAGSYLGASYGWTSYSGAGGSGIVIISYPTGSMNVTSSVTPTISGGNTIHTFTSNGTFTVNSVDPALRAGAFTIPITGLTANTTYHYRGYATNTTGTGYSTDATFTTLTPPIVTTPTAPSVSITEMTAVLGANVTSLGNPAMITKRGTCWDTKPNPTVNCLAEAQASSTVEALIVGGGGGGGTTYSGGGGGGGVINNKSVSISAQTYDIVVGTGGNTVTSGISSSFNNLIAAGGGNGGNYGVGGGIGGSGGGGSGTSNLGVIYPGGNGTSGQGYPGGSSSNVSPYTGGGGGGAGGAGQNGQNATAGAGGVGIANSITGASVYYGGGGGGGGHTSYCTLSGGAGGNGGGGAGSCTTTGTAGTVNTGGGGGGSYSGAGGVGGSGIVIISYPTGSMNVTSSVTPTTSGGNTIHTFTSNGTFTVNSFTVLSTGAYSHTRTGLNPNTTYYYRGYATSASGTAYSQDAIFATLGKPTLADPTAGAVTTTTATLTSNVISFGNNGSTPSISARGICYDTTPTPTNCVAASGTTKGEFSINVTGLTPGTTYYMRGYATNATGIGYSNVKIFSPLGAPTLSIPSASATTGTNAVLGATITSLGGPAILLERGVCYGTSSNPTSSNGTCVSEVVPSIGLVKTLIVAGGGSGGNHNTSNGNGGGGGGGVIYNASVAVSPQTYPIVVGAGGVAIAHATISSGNNGGDSSFNNLISIGGGGGGSSGGTTGKNGGSGGGSAGQCYGAGAGTAGQGYAGGACAATLQPGGGGGGAGGAGVASGSAPTGGNGGPGYGSNISGSMTYYAGGGGGAGNTSERAGDGFDGGGRGFGTTSYYSYNSYPVGVNATTRGSSTLNAIANTGGGGGGGSVYGTSYGWGTGSGAGGSGVVIISYPTGSMTATGGELSYSGGNTIHTFKTSGDFIVSNLISSATGVFGVPVTGLSQNTTYYYRGYARNATGTGYSPDGTFSMTGFPALTPVAASSVATTTATLGATLTALGGTGVTERGVCYGITPFPTTNCIAQEKVSPVRVLVVAGGGGGGGADGGGGGGGGVLINNSMSILGNYGVTVGTGGAGGYGSSYAGSNGTASYFNGMNAIGGGGGGGWGPAPGSGGSGGGSSGGGSTGLGTAGQGYNGGAYTGGMSPGGGGGAGGAGGNGSYSYTCTEYDAESNCIAGYDDAYGGNGGLGYYDSVTGQWYAGGGGGGEYTGYTNYGAGSGGSGVGGNGSTGTDGSYGGNGSNGGGGGGGGWYWTYGGTGGNGAVVISYPTGTNISATSTVAPSTSGGNMIHRFTTDGSFNLPALTTGAYSKAITGLLPDTKYYYRGYAINSTGKAYSEDMNFTTTSTITYKQTDYKFFSNKNGVDVISALSSQNEALNLTKSNDIFRLRMIIGVTGTGALATGGQSFKLQYSPKSDTCDANFTGENYLDVTDKTPIAFYKNTRARDKISLITNAADPTPTIGTVGNLVNQAYIESNIFTNGLASVPTGQSMKWDFSLYDKSVGENSSYCLRLVYADGRVFGDNTFYLSIPEINLAIYKSRGGGSNIDSVAAPAAPVTGATPGSGQGAYLTKCNDGIDNDADTFIDIADPQCHTGGTLQGAYDPAHDSESVATAPPTGGCTVNCGGGGSGGDLGYLWKRVYSLFNFSSFTSSMLGMVFNVFNQ